MKLNSPIRTGNLNKSKIKIGIIVILFCSDISESKTIKSLCKIKSIDLSFNIVLINNYKSYSDKFKILNNLKYTYFDHSDRNHLGYSYYFAINHLSKIGTDWTLILDQDTIIDLNFLNILKKNIPIAKKNNCTIMCPTVIDNNRTVSPSKELFGGILRPINHSYPYFIFKKLFCIGSGMTVNNKIYINLIKNSEAFGLDYLDRYICNEFSNSRYNFLHFNAKCEHSLSIYNFDKLVTPKRYASMISAEKKFMDIYRDSKIDKFIFHIRIFKRILFFLIQRKKIIFIYLLFMSLFS